MSGLLAGCHAIVFDGSRVMNLDGFAAVPSGEGELTELSIPFGDEPVVYSIGAASCAVPGLPAALGELWERLGRLPWARLCEPALELARSGVPLPEMHARSLEMFGELYSLEPAGAALFTTDGRILGEGQILRQPGLAQALEALAEEGAASVYRGSLAEALLGVDGLVISADDLAAYRPLWRDPEVVELYGRRVADPRRPLGPPRAPPASPAPRRAHRDRARAALVRVFEPVPAGGEHTTNMVAVDAHGRACVLTHSLGVGAGLWLPGLRHTAQQPARRVRHRARRAAARRPPREPDGTDARVRRGRARARDRLGRSDAPANRAGHRSRGDPRRGPRRRDRRRRCRASTPRSTSSTRSRESTRLRSRRSRRAGRTVRRWDRLHHYFGGVSCVGRAGAAGDPRRSGAAYACSDYFKSSVSMRRDETNSPTSPIVADRRR